MRRERMESRSLQEIAGEFPDFPLGSLPEGIPPWLVPCPWHNDSCPLWGDLAYVEATGVGTVLAVDYPDPQQREHPGSPRFSCWKVTEMGEQASDTVSSDEFEEVLTRLLQWRTEDLEARQASLCTPDEVARQDADLAELRAVLLERQDRLMRRLPTSGGTH